MSKSFALVVDVKTRWFAKPTLFLLCAFRVDAPTWIVHKLFSLKVRSIEKHC